MSKYTYTPSDGVIQEYFIDQSGNIINPGSAGFDRIKAAALEIQIRDYVNNCAEQTSALVPGKTYEL